MNAVEQELRDRLIEDLGIEDVDPPKGAKSLEVVAFSKMDKDVIVFQDRVSEIVGLLTDGIAGALAHCLRENFGDDLLAIGPIEEFSDPELAGWEITGELHTSSHRTYFFKVKGYGKP